MAFGNISTLYLPTAANAGASQWGTDVRKLLNAADATADLTTVTDHGTGGAVVRTADPYSTNATDGVEANFGWAVTPADMDSVTGARRFFPAGNHTLTARMSHNAATGWNATVVVYVYRVASAANGRARTLLGSASANAELPAASAQVVAVVPVALPEIVFAADETIQYSMEFNVGGVAVVGRLVTFHAGTSAGTAARIDTPVLRVLADTTGAATGVGTAAGETGKVLAAQGAATGLGTAAGALSAQAATTGAATATATAAGQASAVAGTTGSADGLGVAAGLGGKVLGTVGAVEIGPGGGGTTTYVRPIFVFDD